MKIARHFREFLEKKGYLELPSIGRFDMSTESVAMPRGEVFVRKSLSFSPVSKKSFDDSLVRFLCERLHSESCVVYSDISSFTYYINELLMQGLEAEIPGVGFLNRNSINTIQFSYQSSYKRKNPLRNVGVASFMNFWF